MSSNLRFGDTVRIDEDFPIYGGKVGTIVNRSTAPVNIWGESVIANLEWGRTSWQSRRYVRLKGSGQIVMIGVELLIKERI